jgi:hypothetical protein
MYENEIIDDLLNDASNGNVFDFKHKLKTVIQKEVDTKGKEYIDSGKAFDSFVNSARFQNENTIDVIDIATNLYDKYKHSKNRTEMIKNELAKKHYSLKDISKIMQMINDL